MMWVGTTLALVYTFLIRIAMPKIGETNSVYLGMFGGALAFAGYAFATQGWMMFGWITVFALFGFAGPALNGIMSKLVGPKEQGELQGALACVGSLTSVVAPILLTQVFAYFTGPAAPVYFPGSSFFVASLCLVAAALVFTRLRTQPAVAAAEPAE
jgi:MFS transporter, DHA1 family, tetracycline resistance protein